MPFTCATLKVETADGRNFSLLESVRYWTFIHGHPELIVMPEGTTSDGGSIPQECWSLPGFAPFGMLWKAYYLHDFLYQGKDPILWTWPRLDCDRILMEAMENAGAGGLHREAIYRCVREFGQEAFDADRKAAYASRVDLKGFGSPLPSPPS